MSFLSFELLFKPRLLNNLANFPNEPFENSLEWESVLPGKRDAKLKNFCLFKLKGFATAEVSPLKLEFRRFWW